MRKSDVRIFDNLEGLSLEAAELFTEAASRRTAQGRTFTAALSGGTTPQRLFHLLASAPFLERIAWSNAHLFQVDERAVPVDDPQSNYRMIREALLDRLSGSGLEFHRMQAERRDLEAAADDYAAELRQVPGPGDGGFPRLDLVLLGMGPDGHTASLFPGSAGLDEQARWVIPNYVEKFKMYRLTLTFAVINAAEQIVFMVAGADKAEALRGVLGTPSAFGPQPGSDPVPARRIQPANGRLTWLLDREAARLL